MNYQFAKILIACNLANFPIKHNLVLHKNKKRREFFNFLRFSSPEQSFPEPFLEDLNKIWELRHFIPNPNKLEYANCDCAPCSRYKGEILQGW